MSAWSFSSSRSFHKCPRQWYYKTFIASAVSKDATRREAFLLSKLQTLYSWRGSIVDQVILMRYVPTLKRGQRVLLADLLKYAREIFQHQLEFGLAHRLRESGMKVTEIGDRFAAFFDIEYGNTLAQEDIDAAWEDVECALKNLTNMRDLQAQLLSASHLIPQRSLSFTHEGIKAQGQPDLIAFFRDEPPLIIDWKVHTFASQDYRLQLALYAMALTSCKPHKDFPKLFQYEATDVRLVEAQLLTNQQRSYQLTDADIDATSNYIVRSAVNMEMTTDCTDDIITIEDMPVTLNSEECLRCSFRSMCWNQG
jgi:hypothetical protein